MFGANSKFIRDGLSVIEGDEFYFGFNDEKHPFTIWRDNSKIIIMPIDLGDN